MRTTVVIDDSLGVRLKELSSKRGLSEFVNRCIREHFGREERRRRLQALEKAYARVSKVKDLSRDFEGIDREDWPEW